MLIIAIRLSSPATYLHQTAAYRAKNLYKIDFNYFKCSRLFLKKKFHLYSPGTTKEFYSTNVDLCRVLAAGFKLFDIKLYILTLSVVARVTDDLTADPLFFISAPKSYLVSRFH